MFETFSAMIPAIRRLRPIPPALVKRSYCFKRRKAYMGKRKSGSIPEESLILQSHYPLALSPNNAESKPSPPIIDTHTHLISTFSNVRNVLMRC